ncbi:MAG: beta-galactosidase [Clostridia bacterium]|nr:beta-galactosidase [Clostridia bacterium]
MAFTPRFPAFLHGGDYNPDQWLDRPDILAEDIHLMQKAHVNCVSLGIFAWARLEPEEGRYDFGWLDSIVDALWAGGIRIDLATPSGARPAWLAEEYPEVLRVDENGIRHHFGGRHNHCPSSPVYRQKVAAIDRALAERYAKHPAVIMWHLGNEFSGDCYCPLCQQRFREWMKEKYGTLDALNARQWTSFWSMQYSDWAQVEAPSSIGQMSNTSLLVDWRRFSTAQCRSFIAMERDAVKSAAPDLPCTANLMHLFWDYDYFSLAEAIDVVSWDAYPGWHSGDDPATAAEFAMNHDLMRSLKRQPFLMMESTPSLVNWHQVNKLKRPGVHLLSSMQAVAHGSQGVMYFQWRKGRGGPETFHGAVVGHDGRSDTRTFQDVTQVGRALEKLASVYEQPAQQSPVCLLYDWENRWAFEYAQVWLRDKRYMETVLAHYTGLWKQGIAVDLADMRTCPDLSGYRLVIAPKLFMFRCGIEEKLRDYVAGGGTLLMTGLTGVVDADDLAFLGDTPHGLTDVLGVRTLEVDALWPKDRNAIRLADGSEWPVSALCERIAAEGAETVGVYAEDFYAGEPALTRHAFGKGTAWYLAADADQNSLNTLYRRLAQELALPRALDAELPDGVTAHRRGDTVFVENYTDQPQSLGLSGAWEDLLIGRKAEGPLLLPPYGIAALKQS